MIVRYLHRWACAGPTLKLTLIPTLTLIRILRFRLRLRLILMLFVLDATRLIALISSDSDYCCLRIVQLMCELRHRLKNKKRSKKN